MGLRGLSIEEIFSVRKVKVFFREYSDRSEAYLVPQDQLLRDQGKFVLRFVYDVMQEKKPKFLSLSSKEKNSQEPTSFAEYQEQEAGPEHVYMTTCEYYAYERYG